MRITTLVTLSLLAAASPASAQTAEPEKFPFEGGTITITEKESGEKEVAFDGRLLASNYFVAFDREAEVAGSKVALLSLGDGGNACGPGTLIVWKNGNEVDSDYVGEDCGAPPAAITPDRIYFVPYLMPGASQDVVSWTPSDRITIAGRISFVPQPETGWQDLDASSLDHIMDVFGNAAVYAAAQKLLGRDLQAVTMGLVVGGGPETLPSGIFWSEGCVPHACSLSDSFMAVDAKAKALYFAQQTDGGPPKTWPPATRWPKDVRDAMTGALAR